MISRKAIREFAAKHADSRTALDGWYQIAKRATWKNIAELKADFPSADLVGRRTVFNIKGNSYRLIARVNHTTQKVFILKIMTHAEYDKGPDFMSTLKTPTDERRYGQLLSRTRPRAIRNDKELEMMTEELLRLDELEEEGKATPEQREFAELLTVLIEQYEDEHYPIELTGAPHEYLAAVMEHRGQAQSDIAKILGSRSLTSEILSGKREISKAAAKKLAEHLRVPVDLFL